MGAAKILSIDDSEDLLQSNIEMFSKYGCDVLTASNAATGLDLIKNNLDAKLIIIDFEMPDKTGMELLEDICQEIKNPPAMVFLTTKSQNHLADRAKELGVEAWILKPLKEKMAEKLVEKFAST